MKTIIYFLLFSSTILAKNPLKHPFGCPDNSLCSKEFGAKIQRWEKEWKAQKSLKQKNLFLKKNGFPFIYYLKKESLSPQSMAIWKSHCPLHTEENILKILSFKKKGISAPLYAKNPKSSKWIKFNLPFNFSPLFFKKGRVQGIIDWEKDLLPMEFDEMGNGKFITLSPEALYEASLNQKRVPCPKSSEKLPKHPKLFLDTYCEKVSHDAIFYKYWTCP